MNLGFQQSKADYLLFILDNHKGIIFLIVYVDDTFIIGNNEDSINLLKTKLKDLFKLNDLGQLHYFLGIEVSHSNQGIYLS